MIRRYFWDARNIINYLKNTKQDKEDIKYLNVVYDDINQLIDMVESYRDTINSTREIFSSSISLQLNETMRILTTIFYHNTTTFTIDRYFKVWKAANLK